MPIIARATELASRRSPSAIPTSRPARFARTADARTSARTRYPAASSARAMAEPTNPVAPVNSTGSSTTCSAHCVTRFKSGGRSHSPIGNHPAIHQCEMDDRAALTDFARLQRKAERRLRVEFRRCLHDGAPALKEHARDARREALPGLDNAQVLGSYAHL